MFVVVALGAERRTVSSPEGATGLSSFGTPTVVHFCAVLLLAALVTTPAQTRTTLGVCLLTMGAAGLLYGLRVLVRARRQRDYEPVLEDWIWHTVLPFIAYAALLVTGIAMRSVPAAALYAVAFSELLLLFIGIHNAWDAAVWIAFDADRTRRDAKVEPQKPSAPTPDSAAQPPG